MKKLPPMMTILVGLIGLIAGSLLFDLMDKLF